MPKAWNLALRRFYTWKGRYRGMDVNEAKRLKHLQEENAKLKRAVADLTLDNVVLKDLASKLVGPAARGGAVTFCRDKYGMSERRACRLIGISGSVLRYRSKRPDDSWLRERVKQIAHKRQRLGIRGSRPYIGAKGCG